jgi:hypothetical protein
MKFKDLRIGNGFKFCADGVYMIKTSSKSYKNSETGKFIRLSKPESAKLIVKPSM